MNRLITFSHAIAAAALLMMLAGGSARADEKDAAKEKELIETLRTGEPAKKALACKQLAIHGSKEAVPELAKLLGDDKLASWARIALEAIPDPAADEALIKAVGSLKGRLLVGTINSIGVRRSASGVEALTDQLNAEDAQSASAAAVALGRIGNSAASKTLRDLLPNAPANVRSAVAEGCILCAERLVSEGKLAEAVIVYDEVRQADVPKPRIAEATRGAILARKTNGIPLLIEQLKSQDRIMLQIGLNTARELPGREVSDALAAELASTTPDRAELILYALGDRNDPVSPAVLAALKSGPKPVRMAALGVVGRLGDVSSLSTLLEIAADSDSELAQSAKEALASLPGEKVNEEIVSRLSKAQGKSLPALIEVVGQRRIEATPALVKALDSSDAATRSAALIALGATVGPKQLNVLITQAISPKNAADAPAALKALQAACVRMPDKEACAAEVTAAMPKASLAAKSSLLETLAAVGGKKSLDTIAAAVKGKDDELRDTGSRLLGDWLTPDAGPVLLDLAKNAPTEKYQVRALRGYIRVARQFTPDEAERVAMCQKALDATNRVPEQKLVLEVLGRTPTADSLKLAVKAIGIPAIKDDATQTAMAIAQKAGVKAADAKDLLTKAGVEPVKIVITKAEYGAGSNQRDVTETLRKLVGDYPLIVLPAATYNASFGGDPASGAVKQLKVQYQINGKKGEATFAEGAAILLPLPK